MSQKWRCDLGTTFDPAGSLDSLAGFGGRFIDGAMGRSRKEKRRKDRGMANWCDFTEWLQKVLGGHFWLTLYAVRGSERRTTQTSLEIAALPNFFDKKVHEYIAPSAPNMFSNAPNIDLVNRGASENYYSAMVRHQAWVINRVSAAAVHYGASAPAGDRRFALCIHNTRCSAFHSGNISGQIGRRGKEKRDTQETTPFVALIVTVKRVVTWI